MGRTLQKPLAALPFLFRTLNLQSSTYIDKYNAFLTRQML